MPRNGSGTFQLVAGNPVVTGTTISSTVQNNTMSDIASALTASIAVDGQTPATANLPMAGFKHTNVAAASALTDYLRADQAQNASLQYLTSVSGTNTITASASVTPAAYAAGQAFRFVSAGANTGAVTLNVNGLGAKSVTKFGTTALVAGDISSGAVVEVVYDGTQFQLTNVTPAAQTWVTNAQTGSYTLAASDLGKVVTCSGTFTVGTTAAATLNDGWWCWLINIGTGTITLDPNASELVFGPGLSNAGQTSVTLPYSGAVEGPYNVSGVLLQCNGTGFRIVATNEAHGSQLFTANGTWTAPAGVTTAWASGCGGGGGGGGSNGGSAAAGGGGGGLAVTKVRVNVVPGTAYTVTIGTGGSGGSTSGGNGTSGTATTMSGTGFNATGGSFGTGSTSGGGAGGAAGGPGAASGAAGSVLPSVGLWGGAGGGTLFGPPTISALNVNANLNGAGYGAGGAGASGSATAGGNGAPGILIIEW